MMNPYDPTKSDMQMIQGIFYAKMSELTRKANLRQPTRMSSVVSRR